MIIVSQDKSIISTDPKIIEVGFGAEKFNVKVDGRVFGVYAEYETALSVLDETVSNLVNDVSYYYTKPDKDKWTTPEDRKE